MILQPISNPFRGVPFVPIRRWSAPKECWGLGTAEVGVGGEYNTAQLGEYVGGELRVSFGVGAEVRWSLPYPDVSELTFYSDPQGNPVFGLKLGSGAVGVLWFDPVAGGYTFVPVLADGIVCVTVDDPLRAAYANVVAFYERGDVLYYRVQGERFTVERAYCPFPGQLIRAFPVKGRRFEIHGKMN